MRKILLILAVLIGACGGGDDETATPSTADEVVDSTVRTTATTEASKCLTVDSFIKEGIGIPAAAATLAPRGIGSSKDSGDSWFVASATGGIWLTNMDPTNNEDDAGLILAVNDRARSESTIGTAARPGAPAYNGMDEGDAEATGLLDCPTA